MVEKSLLLILSLMFIITMLTMLSRLLKISYPIFLVIAGLIISIIPGIPKIRIHPDLIFLIFLPPILFSAAWNIPWADFWRLKRSISLLGFGLVFFTSTLIAIISHSLIPGFTIALGFVLGGIISPPDAVAATAVLKDIRMPRNVITLLEGESLVNDASSLIVLRFALLATITGSFSFVEASQKFLIISVAGICIGLGIAFIIYIIHRYFPTTTVIDSALTLLAPYVMYMVAENWHFSGVLAVVCGGLFLSYHAHDTLTYESRLNVSGLWETLGFLLNGFIFILIGLQMPYIVRNFTQNTAKGALIYGLIISAAVIVIRIVWVYTVYGIRKMAKSKNHSYELSSKETFLIAWCGMRGVVSLAAALAVPFYLKDDIEFPYRNLILFITFVVILVTLVIQGVTITPLIRLLKIEDVDHEKRKLQDHMIKMRLAEAVLSYIDSNYANDLHHNEPFQVLRNRYQRMIELSKRKFDARHQRLIESEDEFMPRYRQMLLELIDVRRKELVSYRLNGDFDEEMIKDKEFELDLEEARLRNKETNNNE